VNYRADLLNLRTTYKLKLLLREELTKQLLLKEEKNITQKPTTRRNYNSASA
jgi:hypothetical protein